MGKLMKVGGKKLLPKILGGKIAGSRGGIARRRGGRIAGHGRGGALGGASRGRIAGGGRAGAGLGWASTGRHLGRRRTGKKRPATKKRKDMVGDHQGGDTQLEERSDGITMNDQIRGRQQSGLKSLFGPPPGERQANGDIIGRFGARWLLSVPAPAAEETTEDADNVNDDNPKDKKTPKKTTKKSTTNVRMKPLF